LRRIGIDATGWLARYYGGGTEAGGVSVTKSNCDIPAGTPVLVTGATGFTGSLLTRKLVHAGLCVHAIARPSSDLSPLADLDVTWHRGDVFDPATVQSACAEAQVVFHMATTYREGGSSTDLFRRVHVDSTKLLAEAVANRADFKRFVHVSTIGIHGHIEDPPANEDYRFSPGDAYQETKLEAEQWIRAFGKSRGLDVAVIRPCAIYGPGDRRLLKLFRMATRRYFVLLGGGKCLYHFTHVEDLTNVLMLAATHPNAVGEVFICGSDTPIRMEKIGRTVADELGLPLTVLRLPVWPFMMLATLCEVVCRPLGIAPPIYRRRVAFFTKDRAFDTGKLRNVLGYETTIPDEKGLRETAQWYIENDWISLRKRGHS
jgi:dihydroflavonol-4-reductase